MDKPAVAEHQQPSDIVFTALSRAVAGLGHAIQSIDKDSGLLVFNAVRQRVTASAFVETITPTSSRLTVSGSPIQGHVAAAALIGRTALAANVISSADAPARVANEIIDAVSAALGGGTTLSAPSENIAARVIIGVLIVFAIIAFVIFK
jgi:hypothetical protein